MPDDEIVGAVESHGRTRLRVIPHRDRKPVRVKSDAGPIDSRSVDVGVSAGAAVLPDHEVVSAVESRGRETLVGSCGWRARNPATGPSGRRTSSLWGAAALSGIPPRCRWTSVSMPAVITTGAVTLP